MKNLLLLILISCNAFAQNTPDLWKSTTLNNNSKSIHQKNLPLKHLYDLDITTLKKKLGTAKKRDNTNDSSSSIISLPNGDGKLENFRVYENSVMDPVLAAKYPEIKSYIAIGIENPSTIAYFSDSPLGFKSMTVYADQSSVFIEPVTADLKTYTVYKKSDKEITSDHFECNTLDYVIDNTQPLLNNSFAKGADDSKLRTFRLALACTAEYAALFGGTKALALAGMNNTLTRINAIFERDFGVKLVLVANNDALIYTSATTDPYSDYSSKYKWGLENQSNLDTTIGATNYDIGHLLGAGDLNSGDAGGRGTVCVDGAKGKGYTVAASVNYQGDKFDAEFVAHEMGHQLGANHTFTYQTEGGNIAQLEPGSGSTIMSYGGASMKDIQSFRDSYFHAISIQQVTDLIKTKACANVTLTGNAVPTVNAGLDYIIPKGTPFQLTGTVTDANTTDVLTYSWEQMDLGDATNTVPTSTATAGALFRSYTPSASATRYFPNMTTILAGLTSTAGRYIPSEVLPGISRTLNFRLTARDNRAGGSANDTDDMVITVAGSAGPFTVDSQNSAISYVANTTQTVNWTVSGTNANGVNCANVDILFSNDGGVTFPITLVSATPNDGTANIVIPNNVGTTNRIMVKGTSHIFFDVNNTNFTITSGVSDTTIPSTVTVSALGTTASGTNLSWTTATDNIGVTGYNVYQNGVLKTTVTSTSLAVTGLTASTAYSFYVRAKDAAGNLSANSNTINITTLATADTTVPSTVTVSASGTTTSSTNLSWTTATDNIGVTGYNVFQNGVLKTTVTSTSLAVTGLSTSTAYSFYVRAKDAAGNLSTNSNTVNVTTLAPSDTTAPTATTVSASGTTTSNTNLSWNAATDNIGVTGYDVYQNGVLKTTTTATSLAVSGLSASTAYSFYVKAKDAAGNLSANSNTANVTTLAPADTTVPSTVTISALGTTSSGTNLSWTVATDNIGVTGYNVYQNGVLKTTVTTTSLAVTGLSASTAYNFYVRAKDAVGNLAALSNTVNVTTIANTIIKATYCSSKGNSTTKEYINKVQIGVINYVSGNNNGYGDFTSLSTNLVIGSNNTIIITPTWNGQSVNEAYRVWIDFNQDGDFDDNGELVFSKLKTKTSPVSGNMVIPSTALTGSTRMRVSMKYNALPNPCEIFSNGEVEDYTVYIESLETAIPANSNEATTLKGTENNLDATKLSFKLYPNPVNDGVIYFKDIVTNPDYRIFNMIGQELAKGRLEKNAIDVSRLSNGTYIIELSDGINRAAKKFIKQ
ncbi:MAG TPA: GEVED domain-containing protein [Flavobacterium sp.]|nr:GEVED domain-containing protein [Flavobacterium sp.]